MSQYKVIVNGAFGKMGRQAVLSIQQHKQIELVASLGREDNLAQAITQTKANIVLDLTDASVVYQNTQIIIESGAHPVIGTSGLMAEELSVLKQRCQEKKLGGIVVPNFSIAAVLMMQFSAIAARYLPDVEIIEMHHAQKLDAPSGTAIKTAELIAKSRTQRPQKINEKSLLVGARGACHEGVPIHSLRLNGVLARQEVILGSSGETLTLEHQSIDRACFMPGMLLCLEKVASLDGLYYGLEHLLSL